MNRRFALTHLLLPAAGFLLVGWAIAATGFDFRIADLFYDPVSHSFPYRRAFWAAWLLHRGGRYLVALVALGAIFAFLRSFFGARHRHWRRPAAFAVIAMLIGPLLILVAKENNPKPCPWDLVRYGGDREEVDLFDRAAWEQPAGRCFPGGHSSGAFGLFAFYFLLRERDDRRARRVLVGTMLLGVGFGLTQWARGAHVPSHDLVAAAICWYSALFTYLAFGARPFAAAAKVTLPADAEPEAAIGAPDGGALVPAAVAQTCDPG